MEYWKTEIVPPDYLHIWCPAMEDDLPFGVMRKIYKELREIESGLVGSGCFRGWIAHTKLKNAHIMRLLKKFGATPYDIDLTEDNMFFRKDL
jgi:hypothetical protein